VPVTIVVGGQFGSEGKGKVAQYIAKSTGASVAVRVGGSNSGHTVVAPDGRTLVLRHLPTAVVLDDVTCVLGAGTYIDVDVLLNEVETTGITPERLLIDPNAVILNYDDCLEETSMRLQDKIGSTQSGTGSGVCRRIQRQKPILLAKDDERLVRYVRQVVPFMRECLKVGERIVVEGTQGFGLSLLHSPYYPYVTSRDTTASGFISEAGLSPLDVDDIVLVLRAFPIRVAGNSGPLPHELTWEQVSLESGGCRPLIEFTSVTSKVRRVARFSADIVLKAIHINNPTRIVLNHVDYFDSSIYNSSSLPEKVEELISRIEKEIAFPIDYVGTSPSLLIQRSKR
jgi:adenylosuccinate synthase